MVYSYQLYFNDVEKRVQSQWRCWIARIVELNKLIIKNQ